MQLLETVAKNFNERGFIAKACASSAEAVEEIMAVIGDKSVGSGGCGTAKEMGLYDAINAHGNEFFCHSFYDKAERMPIRRKAVAADVYLSGASGIAEDGVIVNIDGAGNRAAGLAFGPETVIVVAGRNKICKNTAAALNRIKTYCCPKNAKDFKHDTPCAVTGKCSDCRSKDRMCRITYIIEMPTRAVKNFYVFLIDEDLGC